MDPNVASIIVAAITTTGVIAAAMFGARKLARNVPTDDESLEVEREKLELAEAKVEILTEKLRLALEEVATEKALRAKCEGDLSHAQREADTLNRRVNDLYAELRMTGQLSDRRLTPRPEDTKG